MFVDSYESPLGRLFLKYSEKGLCAISFSAEIELYFRNAPLPPSVLDNRLKTCRWLDAYFSGRFACDVPLLDLRGTVFRRRVWRELRIVPAGRVVTYGELAQQLGTSARAVGGAVAANPVPLIVPCHRVVGSSGLGGFSFGDVEVKKWLLRHEQVDKNS